MSTRMCEAIAEDLVAFVDGELPETERAPVEAHVAGCLSCRREIDHIARVRALVAGLPCIEPSPEFEERMRGRLVVGAAGASAAVGIRRRGWRPAFWGPPALAAAAAIALVWYWSLARPTRNRLLTPGGRQVAVAPAHPGPSEPERAVQRERREEGRPEREIAAAPGLSPEDLPPELVEHPELFLRYPVVRRLNKLEHFEEVRQHLDPEPLEQVAPRPLG